MLSQIKNVLGFTINSQYGFKTDFHSHLLPGLDDGAQTFEQALELILNLKSLGINKIITTPHIYAHRYLNSRDTIIPKLEELKKYLESKECYIEIAAAAEYYLDETFLERLNKNEPLLTIGDNYVLFELSYMNESHIINEAVFLMLTQGYKPILAHPERYNYYHFDLNKYQEIKNLGVYFQLNINSLSGYYNEECKKMAHKLINANMIDFVGSDTHHMKHINALSVSINTNYYKKLLLNDIKNNEL